MLEIIAQEFDEKEVNKTLAKPLVSPKAPMQAPDQITPRQIVDTLNMLIRQNPKLSPVLLQAIEMIGGQGESTAPTL